MTGRPAQQSENGRFDTGKPVTAWLVATLSAALVFSPVIWRLSGSAYDYLVHARYAEKMLETLSLASPHFLLQMLIIVVSKLFHANSVQSCFLVVLFSIAGTAALLFDKMRTATGREWLSCLLVLGLLLTAPLPLLAPWDRHLYFGYVAVNVYHNPTIILLKPFALLISGFIVTNSSRGGAAGRKGLVLYLLAVAGCALVKPSYTIVIVPAVLAALFISRMRRDMAGNIRSILFVVLLPSLLILSIQYWMTYSAQQLPGVYEGKSSIVFAPLAVMSNVSSWLWAKFLLSVSFPLAVALCYFRRVVTDVRLCFSWLAFAIGSAYTYLLAESGPRMFQGNFIWSGQITLFILFVVTLEFFCEQLRTGRSGDQPRSRVAVLCAAIFLLHVLSGIVFYASEYAASEKFW